MTDEAGLKIVEDHRVRVARQRRDRMQNRILDAVMVTCAARLKEDLPTVDDVIAEAQVSRATFYKYFNSVEEAIGVYGHKLMEEMFTSLGALFTERDDELSRMTTAVQLFLMRSVIDHQWGAFLSRTAHLARETELVERVSQFLAGAREKGLAQFGNSQAAASLVVGAVLEAVRHVARTDLRSREYVEEVTSMILLGVGLSRAKSDELVHDRAIYIRGAAPDRLHWWRDPWIRLAEGETEQRSVAVS